MGDNDDVKKPGNGKENTNNKDDGTKNVSEVEGIFSSIEEEAFIRDIYINRSYASRTTESEENGKQAVLITGILGNYKDQQNSRYLFKTKTQKILFWFLIGLIGVLTAALIIFVIFLFKFNSKMNVEVIVGLVSGCITYLGSLLTIFLVVVKYVFPEDEEKNFNELVSNIIKNHTDRIKNEYDFIIKDNEQKKK